MGSLSAMLKGAERGEEMVVTPPHSEWLERPEAEQQYSDEAIEKVMQALAGEFKRPRSGRYSASSLGMCPRRVMFGFLGAPQIGANLDSLSLMAMGTKLHIFWQMEGLTTGWLRSIEDFTLHPTIPCGGSMDGEIYDDSIFELKTVRNSIYTRIVAKNGEPKYEHLMQTGFYLLTTNRKWASVVYEDRNSGDFFEFRVHLTQQLIEQVLEYLENLESYRARDALPPVLDDCEQRKGDVYNACPYRKHCLAQDDVDDQPPTSKIRPVTIDLVAPGTGLRLGD